MQLYFMDPFEESVRFANFEVNISNFVYLWQFNSYQGSCIAV